jgi:hypothetical protein
MNVTDYSENGPRETIAELEERIELIAARLENCRTIALVARFVIGTGVAIFVASLVGLIRLDVIAVLASITAGIGGFVLLGSNSTTANELTEEMARMESRRGALIGSIGLRVVGGSDGRVEVPLPHAGVVTGWRRERRFDGRGGGLVLEAAHTDCSSCGASAGARLRGA